MSECFKSSGVIKKIYISFKPYFILLMSVWNDIPVFNPIDLNETSLSKYVICIKRIIHKIYNYGLYLSHSCSIAVGVSFLCRVRPRQHIFMGWGWRSQQRKFISDLVSHLEQVRVTYSYICKFIANLCCVYLPRLAYLHRVHSRQLKWVRMTQWSQYKAAECT